MLQSRCLRLAVAAVAFTAAASAAEYALLETGFRLRIERHESAGDRIRLISENGGVVELPAAAVVGFEHDDYTPAGPTAEATEDVEKAPDLHTLIGEIAAAQQLPAELIHSLIAAESAYDVAAVSPKGALGLMQLMPQTARELRVEDPINPAQNIQGGTTYLKQLLQRYAGSSDQLLRALAAYNAGPRSVERYNGLPPYNETRRFVRRVIENFLRLTDPTK